MFDNVRFEGTINLGAICVAVIQLISAYAVLVRVRAMIEEQNIKLKLPWKKAPPLPPPANPPVPASTDQGAAPASSEGDTNVQG